ncbi:MAG TPA: hypothetical protein VGR47_15635 [Terracidiphilus sp.]|nr:hypothetical protein [Terracidiphilus sp.]
MFNFEWNSPEAIEKRRKGRARVHKLGKLKYTLYFATFGCVFGFAVNSFFGFVLGNPADFSLKAILQGAAISFLIFTTLGLAQWHVNERDYRAERNESPKVEQSDRQNH